MLEIVITCGVVVFSKYTTFLWGCGKEPIDGIGMVWFGKVRYGLEWFGLVW